MSDNEIRSHPALDRLVNARKITLLWRVDQ